MNVIFAHGLESSPNGTKATLLKDRFGAVAPDLYKKTFYDQAAILEELIIKLNPVLLVGSSLGGLASIFTLSRSKALPSHLLLLSPAVQPSEPERAEELKPYDGIQEAKSLKMPSGLSTTVIHGERDEIIAMKHVESFCQDIGAKLIKVDDEHRLANHHELICDTIAEIIAAG